MDLTGFKVLEVLRQSFSNLRLRAFEQNGLHTISVSRAAYMGSFSIESFA